MYNWTKILEECGRHIFGLRETPDLLSPWLIEGSAIADDMIRASFLDTDLVVINSLQYVANHNRCDLQYHSYLPVHLVPASDSSSVRKP